MLTEEQGCRVLESAFRRRGYTVARGVPFRERDVSFEIDGWNAKERVGFEYMTREGGDHDDLTQEELARLIPRIEAGELFLLVIDETQVEDADELLFAADRFLDEVERRRGVRPKKAGAPAKKKPAKKKPAKKKPAKKKPAKKKPAKKKPAKRKPAKKKPAKKKGRAR